MARTTKIVTIIFGTNIYRKNADSSILFTDLTSIRNSNFGFGRLRLWRFPIAPIRPLIRVTLGTPVGQGLARLLRACPNNIPWWEFTVVFYTCGYVWGLNESVKKRRITFYPWDWDNPLGQVWTCLGALGIAINKRPSYRHLIIFWLHRDSVLVVGQLL